ncbi:hypothetical protein F4775DRAFT_537819 [Biscogniauxia sp. FL1348]|nr:hypothetical protein F4775DRAFT_537819 [Biscogniauxia sp. FL1348]
MTGLVMNRYNGPTLTACPVAKPEGKRLRRKLQKFTSHHHRNYLSNHAAETKGQGFGHDVSQPNRFTRHETSPPAQPCLPLPSDLGDGKWLDQFQKSGYLSPAEPVVRFAEPVWSHPQSRPHPQSHQVNIVPELAHLSIEHEKPRKPPSQAGSFPSSVPSLNSSVLRKYAKTPVFRIGQLEGPPGRDHNTVAKVSSVELIAESYRALLESRCATPDEPALLPSPLRMEESLSDDADLPEVGCGHGHGHGHVHKDALVQRERKVPDTPPTLESPRSDDGTLVAFEEDTIYFKPVSFSTDPPLPLRSGDLRQPELPPSPMKTPDTPESPSLQICLDLLTRELSSAAAGSLQRPSAETSALQIWVMIEAYERLRDQVREMKLEKDQRDAMGAMLDMWLRALYEVHDKMTGHDARMSESDYGDLESEDLD